MKNRIAIYKTLLLLVISFSILSCEDFFETTLDLETPEYEEKLAISAVFPMEEDAATFNDDRSLLVSKTVGLNDDLDDGRENNATVQLVSSDGTIYSFIPFDFSSGSLGRNNYVLPEDVELEEGETYTLQVESQDGKTASSQTTIPKKPVIISATYDENGGLDSDGDEVSAVDIVFQDDPDVENFYRLELYAVSNPTSSFYNEIYLDSNDPAAREGAGYDDLIIEDTQFNGEEYRLRVLFDRFFQPQEDQPLVIKMASISADQYRFDKILYSYRDNKDNPFSSPTQIHSNVEGGLGIFAIENRVEFIVDQ